MHKEPPPFFLKSSHILIHQSLLIQTVWQFPEQGPSTKTKPKPSSKLFNILLLSVTYLHLKGFAADYQNPEQNCNAIPDSSLAL